MRASSRALSWPPILARDKKGRENRAAWCKASACTTCTGLVGITPRRSAGRRARRGGRSLEASQRVPHGRLFSRCWGRFGLFSRRICRTEKLVKSDTGARRKLGVARLGHCSEHVVKLPLHGLGKLRISACLRGQQHFDGRFNGHRSGLHLEESRSDQTAEIGKFGVIHELLHRSRRAGAQAAGGGNVEAEALSGGIA